jgi:hypothetical protein
VGKKEIVFELEIDGMMRAIKLIGIDESKSKAD